MITRNYYNELHPFQLIDFLNKEFDLELTEYQKSKISRPARTWLYYYGRFSDKEETEISKSILFYIKQFFMRLIGIPSFIVAFILYKIVVIPILFIVTGKNSYYFNVKYKKGIIGHFFERWAGSLNLL